MVTKRVFYLLVALVLAASLGPLPATAQGTVVLTIAGGDNQTAYIGTAYGAPLQVTLTDAGAPVAGAAVHFIALPVDKKASLTPDAFTVATDANGVASVSVTANGYVGALEVHAICGEQTAIFHLTNTQELMVTIAGGDNQSGVVGTAYAAPLQVVVTSHVVPVAGVVVQFDAPKHPGDASLVPDSLTATTGADGIASVAVTANVYEGPLEVTASYNGQSATFHLSNVLHPSDQPYWAASSCQFNAGAAADDPAASSNAQVCQAQTTKIDCEQHWFCWWRNTDYQNALADQTAYERSHVHKLVYAASGLTVMIFQALLDVGGTYPPPPPLSQRGTWAANSVAIVASSEMLLVGPGGSVSGGNYAKIAFQKAYSGFMGKQLKGIVYTSTDPQVTWGVSYWRNLFGSSVPLMVSSEFEAARAYRDAVQAAEGVRDTFVYGRELEWGVDGFLGMGGYRDYVPNAPGLAPLTSIDMFISHAVDIPVNGKVVTLIPTLDEIGGLSLWLPAQRILIPCDLFGPYLPPIAPLNGRYVSIDHALATLDYYRSLGAETLLWLHGDYVSGEADVYAALTAEYDALNYIRTQTLKYISYDFALDDIVTVVQLPANLANSPYCQPWLQDVPAIIRAVYHDYLGWFDGDAASLVTLSSMESAQRFVALAGGENAVLQAAKQAVTEHTRSGAQWALEILGQLRVAYPSEKADDLYRQALRMLGFTTKNAPQRNWYLTEAARVQGAY